MICKICFREHDDNPDTHTFMKGADGKVVAPPDMPPQVKFMIDNWREITADSSFPSSLVEPKEPKDKRGMTFGMGKRH